MIRIIIFYCKIKQNYKFVFSIIIGDLFFLFALWEIAPLPSFAQQVLEDRRPKRLATFVVDGAVHQRLEANGFRLTVLVQ